MKTINFLLTALFVFCSANAKNDSVFVKIVGDTVQIWNTDVPANCAARFSFSHVYLDSNGIVITECDTVGPIAKCVCSFDLHVSLTGLTVGKYSVAVYRQELKKYFYLNDTTYLIGSTVFTVTGPNLLPYFSITGFQSGCAKVPVSLGRKEASPPQSIRHINHPNPFNSSTTISFFIPEGLSPSTVELNVYDEQGQLVKQLLKSTLPSGERAVRWDATNDDGQAVASGIYLYHLLIGGQRQIGKMSLVR